MKRTSATLLNPYLLGLMLLGLAFCVRSTARAVEIESADDIKFITLKNESGMTVRVTNFGAIIMSIVVPDRDGNLAVQRIQEALKALGK